MKPTAEEQRILDAMIDWYIGEAAPMFKESERNAAFLQATSAAMNVLNQRTEERFTMAFSALLRNDPGRYKALHSALSQAIHVKLGGRGPGSHVKLVEPSPGEHTLRNYLAAMTACFEAARGQDGALRTLDQNSNPDEGVQFARKCWAALRAARVFDFQLDDYAAIHRAADIYTCEKIAGVEWTLTKEVTQEDAAKYRAAIDTAATKVPFPDPLPFEHTYIGLGHGLPLADHQWMAYVVGQQRSRVVGAAILGYLIWPSDGGEVVAIIQVVEAEDNYILPSVVCHRGVWMDATLNLAPWITTHLIATINEHRQVVLESPTRPSFAQRRDFEKRGKQLKVAGLVPKPFYLVRLEKRLIEETGARTRETLSKISRELAYRHDRRGHERCYIRRGRLPLLPKDGKKLEEAGYKVWTLTEPDSNAYRQLMERGQPPKSADEWIAILTKWIDPTVVGPEDKPYIPAIRIPTGNRGSTATPGAPREV